MKSAIPWITFKDVAPGATRVEMSLAPEIILKETDGGWSRAGDEGRSEPTGEAGVIVYEEEDAGARGRPFTFKAVALEGVPLPSFVVPRLLLKTVPGGEDSIRTSARYWVESHGRRLAVCLTRRSPMDWRPGRRPARRAR